MSHTNSTTNYNLPQFVGTDTPGWLTDVNGAMSAIDAAIYARQQGVAQNAQDISALTARVVQTESDISAASTEIDDAEADIATNTAAIANQQTAINNNTNNISALNTIVAALQAKQPVTTSVIMQAVDWDNNNQYEFTDAAVTADSVIFIGPAEGITDVQLAAFQGANIAPVSITAGSGFIVRAAGDVPTIDIPVKVVREG